ncbi:hypothetical protein [Streptomyces sp. NPDC051218]|uniref:hypothetical protein n=1 Tax=Streptomyces sp. NPDC051218 TaxID=3365645 RepID=UPI0037B36A6A
MTAALLSLVSHDAAPGRTPHSAPDVPLLRRSPSPPPGNAGTRITPALPPAFEAFHALHSPCYLGYAQLHLPPHDAVDAVAHTLGHLLTHWPHVISHPNPTAYAWHQLVHLTGSRHHPLPLAATSPQQYDTVLLHHALGYPHHTIADTTGIHPTKTHYLTRTWHPHPPVRNTTHPNTTTPTRNSRPHT